MKKLSIVIAILVVIAGGIFGYRYEKNRSNSSVSTAVATTAPSTISYPGVDGKNALNLLKVNHKVDVKTSSYGDYVQGIDGVEGDTGHFWSFYVNGSMASVGAGAYVSKSTDKIEWKFDKITQ